MDFEEHSVLMAEALVADRTLAAMYVSIPVL
jgi:hypothetical protein